MAPLPRFRHKCTRFVGNRPGLYFPLMEVRKRIRYGPGVAPVAPDTELVIDGFYRSGNGFALRAFLSAQSRRVRIANRTHVPATVVRAAQLHIPTLVLIRQPRDVVLSYMLKWPHLTARDGFREYIDYYRSILPFRDSYVVASFEEVTSDFGAVIGHINERFGTNFELFHHDPANVERVFDMIEQRDYGAFQGDISKASVPSAEKERLKAEHRRLIEAESLRPLIAEAERVYEEFLGTTKSPAYRESMHTLETTR